MKQISLFILMAAALVMGFVACGDDEDDVNEGEIIDLSTVKCGDDEDDVNEGEVIDLSTVKYELILKNGDVVTGRLTENVMVLVANGAKITLRDAFIKSEKTTDNDKWAGITCLGNATIVVEGNDTVRGNIPGFPGIMPGPTGTTLTIRGTGSLHVSGNHGAGIGGTSEGVGGSNSTRTNGDCGNIVIEGGTINATGGDYCAGIGYGKGLLTDRFQYGCGNITIKGGTVTAKGGQMAAGIGSGGSGSCSCGNITITGGTVMAIGGKLAPGIGSGMGYAYINPSSASVNYYYSVCGDILISGGTVTAVGGLSAAGIGSGMAVSICSNINITNGISHVTATKGEKSQNSIGAGESGDCGKVTITADPSKVTRN